MTVNLFLTGKTGRVLNGARYVPTKGLSENIQL